MMKSQHLVAIFTVLFLNGNAVAQFGSGLPVIIPEPSSGVAPSLSSAPAMPLPELSSQDLALLEHATQANSQPRVDIPAAQVTNVLDDDAAAALQPNQEMVDAGSAVAEGPEFAQIISLVQDLVDASARGSAEVQGVIEDIKECLSKVTDDAEYVNTLAEICGELKELPRDVLQKISEALGARLRNAMASWKLAEENYSPFIDLAAAFPEVALDTAVAELRAIIETDLLEGDFTKLIIALTELSLLPERLAWMLLDLSNRYADKFMAELKEGRGLYAFMQLIVRYPDQLEQLLKHSSAAAILVKVLTLSVDNDDFPPARLFPYSGSRDHARSRSRSRSSSSLYSLASSPSPSRERDCRDDRSLLSKTGIDQEKLKKLLRYFIEVNPAGFVELLCNEGMESGVDFVVTNVAQDYPELLIRSSNDSGVTSLAERSPGAFLNLLLFRGSSVILENTYFRNSLSAFAEYNPEGFVDLLARLFQDDRVYPAASHDLPVQIVIEVAQKYPELIVRSKESEAESLAERYPEEFGALLTDLWRSKVSASPTILNDKQLQEGLEFLATRKSQSFIGLLLHIDSFYRSRSLLDTVLDVAERHPELLVRSNNGVECLVERAPETFLNILSLLPDILESAYFRENLSALAEHNPKAFVKLLSCGPLPAVVREVAHTHPELLIVGNGEVKSLAEKNPKAFVALLRYSDILDDERLHEGLELLTVRNPKALINLLLQLKAFPDRQRSVVIDVVRRHPELIIGCLNNGEVASLAERDPGTFVAILTGYPDILNGEQLHEGLAFLAARKPKKFIKLLTKWKEFHAIGCLPIVAGVAKRYSGLLIRCSAEREVEGLAEIDPDAFMAILTSYSDILNGKQLHDGLDFLVAQKPKAFVEFLKAWILSDVEWSPIVVEIVRNHPELLMRSSDDNGVASLAERDPDAFVATLIRYPGILNNRQLREGLAFLAPEAFVNLLLHWGSLPHLLRPVVTEVAKEHPGTENLAERDPLAFVRLLKEAAILDNGRLYSVLYRLARSVEIQGYDGYPETHPFRQLFLAWVTSPTGQFPIALALGLKCGSVRVCDDDEGLYVEAGYVGSGSGVLFGEFDMDDKQFLGSIEFLAAHDPEAFFALANVFSQAGWPPIMAELARKYPGLFIRSSYNPAAGSLAERFPFEFVNLMHEPGILSDKQLQEGLEFLATNNPIAFHHLLDAWLSSPTGHLPIAARIAREYGFLAKKGSQPCTRPTSGGDTDDPTDGDLGPCSPKCPRYSPSSPNYPPGGTIA